MQTLHGFPYFEIEFDTEGGFVSQDQLPEARDFVADARQGASDVIAISHGWNDNMDDARSLYDKFFANFRQQLDSGAIVAPNARRFAIIAVLWPSKKFENADLIPGGAAALGNLTGIGATGGGAATTTGVPSPTDDQLRPRKLMS